MQLAGNVIIVIVWIIYTIICEVIYHKVFTVYYFSLGRGCLTEVVGCGFVAAILAGLTMYLYIPLAVIVVVLGIIIPLVVPAMKYGDMPGKVLVRVLAIILTVCILLAGSAYKKNQEESMANRAETYDVSCNI